MITRYTIHNFKNHADTTLELGALTLLTGVNGTGKSSVMQSLLLLRESFLRDSSLACLCLNGDSVDISGSAELVNGDVADEQDILRLTVQADGQELSFAYRYPSRDSDELPAINDERHDMENCALFTNSFQYLSAFRTGPMVSYGSSPSKAYRLRQVSGKLGKGEYAVHFLASHGNEELAIPALRHDEGSENLTLYTQTELWMSEISDGIRFKIDQAGNTYNLKLGYERSGLPTAFHRAMSSGYGITYILSVLVAVLSAKPGALLLIENPEAHIHPAGQAALIRLFATAARNGVQIILETHSDHIVNGTLVNAKRGIISRDDISVYFFRHDRRHNASATRLRIADNGRIAEAPEGFFDQMDADTEVLFGITD